jgi:molecular chaperone DnaK
VNEPIFGIDLGTTNSAIAWVRDGVPEILGDGDDVLLPSVVGFDLQDRLRVGVEARNQLAAYPDRTIASIKRRMGDDMHVTLGPHRLTPPEVSAVILRELARRGERATGVPVKRVVVTVPAFFRDAQRHATRLAGEIAGLEVVRILNEPTAAALAYGADEDGRERLIVVYDLGGGTFDVSVVRASGELVEVLSSHGDVELGGDDFDRLLAEELVRGLPGTDPLVDRKLRGRLLQVAERAKRTLTEESYVRVQEPFLGEDGNGLPRNLDVEISRSRFEEIVHPLLERTFDSVLEAVERAGRSLADVDDVLLVGGSTRSPIVGQRLGELFGKPPRRDVHPDLCVALGAALAGARAAGQRAGRVLVDVTPYSFGPSHVDEVDGEELLDAYTPVIEAGTPLPVTRSASYFTCHDSQQAWDVRIFQGENRDARQNVLVGRFTIDGLSNVPAGNEVVCRMHLDLDGILTVEAIEKRTGLAKSVVVEGASKRKSDAELDELRAKTEALFEAEVRETVDADGGAEDAISPADADDKEELTKHMTKLLTVGAAKLWKMAPSDRADFTRFAETIGEALSRGEPESAASAAAELEDLLRYLDEA